MAAGRRLFKFNETDFREDAPPTGKRRIVNAPPCPSDAAHLISEHGLKLVLSSTAKSVLSPKERARFNAILRGDFS